MLEKLTPSEAVDLTRKLFHDSAQSIFWASPLVRVLEHREPKLALRWAIVLYKELLRVRRKAGLEGQQMAWLVDLVSLCEREGVCELCNKTGFEIWHNDPIQNRLERGIARLYWALQRHAMGNMEPDYYLHVSAAASMLADNGIEPGDMDEATVEHGISIFQRLVAEKRCGMK